MNNFKIKVILAAMLFSSCEKVIDLKLDNAEPVVVIDGGLSDQNENQVIKVSKTYNFTEPNKFNGVTGAKVVLTRPNGSTINYNEIAPGIYQSAKFRGVTGVRYALDVTIDGKIYSAASTMPGKVMLDSLSFRQFNFFGKINTYVAVNYQDPVEVQNQYRYILKVKGKVEDDMVSEDRFNNGNSVSDVIFYKLDDLVSGDSLHVEFQCIDRNVYRYFYSLGQNAGNGGPPVSPANPVSNFNNGALGVFNAYTSSKRTAVIK
ncbi:MULTISPECIES: DUF4249 domain-containing protein [Pedobacter]|uniref:DUF4249 domain-containing protein n=1 Tax=Pedobacter heparinus (strain ATCC 13125 / DSM 2366 / CIP 104194 / JCM 7457 / NBRC 12017 / NCIMB 9290 / NRRL B-14731 / HIM 762-3) TaxID=485917 RepID=C6Y044_PEDHD|nr:MULTISPECIES: DUF4249 domain-containing protein [Pedobacter]ACU04756.1 hypothetical protein Phep_2552 [Pedobacter heparinus DSM 2366]MBB5437394.1 hypothetical protein [Pedobacter sp. AK017]